MRRWPMPCPACAATCRTTSRASARRADIPDTAVEIDGIAELWFDDQAALEAAARTPEMKALHADGAKFIGRIKSYVVEEKFVIGS